MRFFATNRMKSTNTVTAFFSAVLILLHFTLTGLFDSSVMFVGDILVQLSDLQSSTMGFLQTVLQSLFGDRDEDEPTMSPSDCLEKWRLVMDINALATVLIAQKTGAVITTTWDDLAVEGNFDDCSHHQREALVNIFR